LRENIRMTFRMNLRQRFWSRWKREEGVTAMEYALIGALVSIAAIIALTSLGLSVDGLLATLLPAFQ